ncbi:stage V sporulation protein AB [Clostridia bacterium OttesenSCG-928-F22]|nr:stage V sporulation protein AB [Clostridia bacterium OttesenSCG-928-F22]
MGKAFGVLLGVTQGVTSGVIVVAIIVALNIIPQFAGIIIFKHKINRVIIWAMLLGLLLGSATSLFDVSLSANAAYCLLIGLFFGIFIGALSSAVTEVLNVFPRMLEGLNLKKYAQICVIVFALSKLVFSIVYWVFPQLR